MTATAAMRAELRRMTDEPTTTTYSDALLDDYIERYPCVDERGVAPYYYDRTTDPPTQVAVVGWYPTYDLHAAAADIWEEKASAQAEEFDFPHENGIYQHSTVYENYMRKARQHRARRKAKTARAIPWPSRNRLGDRNVGNWNDPYE